MPTPKGIPRNHKALSGDGTEISATLGVVPILRELEVGKLRVIGTGFYITRYGLFLTARHVFDNIIEADDPSGQSLRIFHHTGDNFHIRHVTKISVADQADIALGQAAAASEPRPLFGRLILLRIQQQTLWAGVRTSADDPLRT